MTRRRSANELEMGYTTRMFLGAIPYDLCQDMPVRSQTSETKQNTTNTANKWHHESITCAAWSKPGLTDLYEVHVVQIRKYNLERFIRRGGSKARTEGVIRWDSGSLVTKAYVKIVHDKWRGGVREPGAHGRRWGTLGDITLENRDDASSGPRQQVNNVNSKCVKGYHPIAGRSETKRNGESTQ